MNKEQILWLARDEDEHLVGHYSLFIREPVHKRWGAWYSCRGGTRLFKIYPRIFADTFPTLTLKPGQKCKVKLTQTEAGIKLERL